MKTVWNRLEELLDAGALGEPVPGSAGPRRGEPRRASRSGPGDIPPGGRPPCELRDVALPMSASEVTTAAGAARSRPCRRGRRWNGMPGRSDLIGLALVATEGEEAGSPSWCPVTSSVPPRW